MKPLPAALLALLGTLPDETCKIILNTNRRGHWEIEVFSRYSLDEATEALIVPSSHGEPSQRQRHILT